MACIAGMVLLIAGVVVVVSAATSSSPRSSYRTWLGLAVCGAGVWIVVHWPPVLGSVRIDAAYWTTMVLTAVAEFGLGLLFGYVVLVRMRRSGRGDRDVR